MLRSHPRAGWRGSAFASTAALLGLAMPASLAGCGGGCNLSLAVSVRAQGSSAVVSVVVTEGGASEAGVPVILHTLEAGGPSKTSAGGRLLTPLPIYTDGTGTARYTLAAYATAEPAPVIGIEADYDGGQLKRGGYLCPAHGRGYLPASNVGS